MKSITHFFSHFKPAFLVKQADQPFIEFGRSKLWCLGFILMAKLSFAQNHWDQNWINVNPSQLNGYWGQELLLNLPEPYEKKAWIELEGNLPLQSSAELDSWSGRLGHPFLDHSSVGDQRQALLWGASAAIPLYDGRLKVAWAKTRAIDVEMIQPNLIREMRDSTADQEIALVAQLNKKGAFHLESSRISAFYRLDFAFGPQVDFGIHRESWSVHSMVYWQGSLNGYYRDSKNGASQVQNIHIGDSLWSGYGLGIWEGAVWIPELKVQWGLLKMGWVYPQKTIFKGLGQMKGQSILAVDSFSQNWKWKNVADWSDSAHRSSLSENSTHRLSEKLNDLEVSFPSTVNVQIEWLYQTFWTSYTWWAQDLETKIKESSFPGLIWNGSREHQLMFSLQYDLFGFKMRNHLGFLMVHPSEQISVATTSPNQIDVEFLNYNRSFMALIEGDLNREFGPFIGRLDVGFIPELNLKSELKYVF